MKSKLALVLPLFFLTGCSTTDLKKTVVGVSTLGRIVTPNTAPARSAFLRTIRTVEKRGIRFDLLQCARKAQGEVVCKFSASSNQNDKRLQIYGGKGGYVSYLYSRAIASGNEYSATSVSIGGSEKKKYVSRTLIANVRMEVSLSFSSIPSNLKRLSALEIVTGVGQESKIQFTNVAISN